MNREEFLKELSKINIKLDENAINKLEKYHQILTQENQKYNLTRIIKKEDVYLKHFYDSLTLTEVVSLSSGKSLCDIGSGAGFPGLVIAICFPNINVTLIESNSKKCKFLNLVKETLSLTNVSVINTRVEDYAKIKREVFDIVTARAVAPLKHLLEYGIPLVKVQGLFIAMKSNIDNEIQNIEKYYQKLDIIEEKKIIFTLPKENSLRTIISYKKQKSTNPKYPRKYSDIIKREIK